MNNIAVLTAPLLVGYLLDLILGDPAWMPHPARVIGWFARSLGFVVKWAFPRTEKGELAAGALLSILAPIVSLLIPALLLAIAQTIHTALWFALETMLCYQLISTRGLHDAGMRVVYALDREEHGDLSRARLALSRMVEKDTGSMNRQEIIENTIGVIADGTTGGATAPLMFLAAGGGALGVFYRAVSVTASAASRESANIAASARTLSGLCDFIPSRVGGALLALAARASGLNAESAFRAYRRGCKEYGSGCLAQSVFACALGIRQDGQACGDSVGRPAKPDDIRLASRMMLFSSLFCVLLLSLVKIAVLYVII